MRILDLHCDTLLKALLASQDGMPFSLVSNDLMLDIGRMVEGRYLGQFFAVFVPVEGVPGATPGEAAQAMLETAWKMIGMHTDGLQKDRERIRLAGDYAGIIANQEAGRLSAMLSMEGLGYLQGDLSLVGEFHAAGVRMAGPIWNIENEFAFPNSTDPQVMGRGLKPAGFDLVAELDRLGIIIDVSHLSDGGFWDCIQSSKHPVIASHSNSRAVCDHPRNLSDEMLKALADSGGVAGLNYCPAFLKDTGLPLGQGTSRIKDMVRHMLHIREVAGIEALALGSDFDGISGEFEIGDASEVVTLIPALEQAGFSPTEIDKVTHENILRVIRDVC